MKQAHIMRDITVFIDEELNGIDNDVYEQLSEKLKRQLNSISTLNTKLQDIAHEQARYEMEQRQQEFLLKATELFSHKIVTDYIDETDGEGENYWADNTISELIKDLGIYVQNL